MVSLTQVPHRLTALFGRAEHATFAGGLLRTERLLTLVGAPGVGKTRLALVVAGNVAARYAGGVVWVELGPVAPPATVARTVLAALGYTEAPGSAPAEQATVALGDLPVLLVLDNCEHLAQECAELVLGMLAGNPSVSVLATSREPLRVPSEVTLRVPSLTVPPPDAELSVDALLGADAVAMFVDRARQANPSFVLAADNAEAVADVCRRLGGIPLAIELAAARCREMSPQRIARQLDDRFRLLTLGARTAPAREQTLLASFAWSHDLLDPTEQIVFRRLAAFAGPFPLEAAEAIVAGCGDVHRGEVFEVLSRLVEKNLVAGDEDAGHAPRYSMLESLRAFARDRARTARELEVLEAGHARWWAEWIGPRGSAPTDALLEEIDTYHANLVTALAWAVEDAETGLRLLAGVARVWAQTGRAADAMAAVDGLLTEGNLREHRDAWFDAASRAFDLVFLARGPDAFDALVQRVAERLGPEDDEFHRAQVRVQSRVPGAQETFLALARSRGDRYAAASVAGELAWSDPVASTAVLADAERAADESGNRYLRLAVLLAQAELAATLGDLGSAAHRAEQILAAGHSFVWSQGLRLVSATALLTGDEAALARSLDMARRLWRRSPGATLWVDAAQHRLDLLRGGASVLDPDVVEPQPSVLLVPGTLWLVSREALDAGATPAAVVTHARARTVAGPYGTAVLRAVEGATTGDDRCWREALRHAAANDLQLVAVDALEGLAVCAARSGDAGRCRRLLAAAEAVRDDTGYRWRFERERRAVDAARAAAEATLGPTATAAAVHEGRRRTWHETAALELRAVGARRPVHGWASLTPAEESVARLVAEGLTNPQIAERLVVGRATVKTHLAHIFTKLGVRTRSELASVVSGRQAETRD